MELPTARRGVFLRSLTAADGLAFHALLQRNAAHLCQFGDYLVAIGEDAAHWVDEFSVSDPRLDFGLRYLPVAEQVVPQGDRLPGQLRSRAAGGRATEAGRSSHVSPPIGDDGVRRDEHVVGLLC
jgi:hypothetical protein